MLFGQNKYLLYFECYHIKLQRGTAIFKACNISFQVYSFFFDFFWFFAFRVPIALCGSSCHILQSRITGDQPRRTRNRHISINRYNAEQIRYRRIMVSARESRMLSRALSCQPAASCRGPAGRTVPAPCHRFLFLSIVAGKATRGVRKPFMIESIHGDTVKTRAGQPPGKEGNGEREIMRSDSHPIP